MRTLQLFSTEDINIPLSVKVAEAKASIRKLFEKGHYPVCAFSSGKDSSVVASLLLSAASEYTANGGTVEVLITTGDTLVENPTIQKLYRSEHKKMIAYGKAHGFNVRTKIVTPSLSSTFQMKILTGRGIPSYAGGSNDCTQDLKIQSQRSYRNKLLKQLLSQHKEAVTLLGTRYDESIRRALNMASRGERSDEPVRNKADELILSPIAWWSQEDVFEYLGEVASGLIESYSDFKDTLTIYAHSAGTSCAVVADAILDGKKQMKGGCGARHGCHTCLKAEDKSLNAMVEYSPEYAYAKPLLKFNNFLRAIRYDWNRRHWVGRTIKAGFICCEPDTFHPTTIRELSRYMLQMDYDEKVRADDAGEQPMFQMLTLDLMIAIDASASLNGVAKPFQLWADKAEIESGRTRYDIPEIEVVKESPMPAAKFLYVGKEWDSISGAGQLTGLRNAYFEALTADSPCAPILKPLNNGHLAWDIETALDFSIDMESAFMIEEFEIDRLVEMNQRGFPPGGITSGYIWYLSYGCLQISHSQKSKHDEVLRRTAYKDSLGLTVEYDVDALYQSAISYSDLPDDARKAWANKATTSTSQVCFEL